MKKNSKVIPEKKKTFKGFGKPIPKTKTTTIQRQKLIENSPEFGKHKQFIRLCEEKRSDLEFRFTQLWRIVTSKLNLQMAWAAICKNKGSETLGVDEISVDGFGTEKINELRTELLSGEYKPDKIRRVWIPKPGTNKRRPLGIPTFKDRVVQRAVANVLGAIFEPHFKVKEQLHNKICRNYGFRQGIRPQEAMMSLKALLPMHANAIELDIEGAFNHVHHGHILNQLSKKVKDQRLLRLVKQMLKAEIMENDGKSDIPFEGTPQGSILSPLLWNISFEAFDDFVRNDLNEFIEDINKENNRIERNIENPDYASAGLTALKSRMRVKAMREQGRSNNDPIVRRNLEKIKILKKRAEKLPSKINRNNISRIKVFRFADDVLILHDGPDWETKEIFKRVTKFLKTIGLTVSPSKSELKKTDKINNPVRFIGFQLVQRKSKVHRVRQTRKGLSKLIKRRSRKGTIIRPDEKRILAKLAQRHMCIPKKNHFPQHVAKFLATDDFSIVSHFRLMLTGMINYYGPVVTDSSFLTRIGYICLYSAAFTLANKHKTTTQKLFKKFGKTLKTTKTLPDGTQLITEIPEVKHLWKESVHSWINHITPSFDPFKHSIRTRTVAKLTNVCRICGANTSLQMHHVNKLKNLKAAGFNRIMISMKRRQIPVCHTCHMSIHDGTYDGIRLKDISRPDVT